MNESIMHTIVKDPRSRDAFILLTPLLFCFEKIGNHANEGREAKKIHCRCHFENTIK